MKQKVQRWVHKIDKHIKTADLQPQAAQMILSKSLQLNESICNGWFLTVRMLLHPCETQSTRVSGLLYLKGYREGDTFSLSTRKGGLDILDLVTSAHFSHSAALVYKKM